MPWCLQPLETEHLKVGRNLRDHCPASHSFLAAGLIPLDKLSNRDSSHSQKQNLPDVMALHWLPPTLQASFLPRASAQHGAQIHAESRSTGPLWHIGTTCKMWAVRLHCDCVMCGQTEPSSELLSCKVDFLEPDFGDLYLFLLWVLLLSQSG